MSFDTLFNKNNQNIFLLADNEQKFNKVVALLKSKGFQWVGLTNDLTYAFCKKQCHGNVKLLIHAFKNTITNKLDMQFGYKALYLTYPQYKNGIEIIDIDKL